MKASFILFCFVALQLLHANAHTYMSAININGVNLPEGDCLRPHRPYQKEYPIMDLSSGDQTCGFLPWNLNPANRKCPVTAGSTLALQWFHNYPGKFDADSIIEYTHKGPAMVYMAKSETGLGPVWFKIFEEGYNEATNKWGVDTVRENRGLLTFTIPADIEPGNYLIRGEMIALHEGYAIGSSQQYVGCAEVTVSGNGKANPTGVPMPGTYKPTDPGINVNVYQPVRNYVIPGPALYKSGSAPTSSPTPAPTNAPTSAPTTAPTSAPTTAPTSAPTTAPTSAPTKAPTTAPTTAPTSAPTKAPTTAPTSAPTKAPTTAPTAPPSGATNAPTSGITIQMSSSSSAWWFAIAVDSGSITTSTVEIKDASMSSYAKFESTTWGYWIFSPSAGISLPISLRLTSASGQQVVLTDIIRSFSQSTLIQTGSSYTSSTTAPTNAPTTVPTNAPTYAPTAAPTYAPTTAPTNAPTTAPTNAPTTAPTRAPTATPTTAPSTETVKFQLHSGSSEWWMAVAVLNTDKVAKLEFKDDGAFTSWTEMTSSDWGYYVLTTNGKSVKAPFSLRATSTTGATATASGSSISGTVLDSKTSF